MEVNSVFFSDYATPVEVAVVQFAQVKLVYLFKTTNIDLPPPPPPLPLKCR